MSAEFEYSGRNKEAAEVKKGDIVALTGYSKQASKVVEVSPVGDKIKIRTFDDNQRTFQATKLIRIYQ